MKKYLLIAISISTLGCQRSTEADFKAAVDDNTKATHSTQLKNTCETVFSKALKESTTSKQVCKTLLESTNTELSICEDEIANPKYSNLIKDCRSELNSRLQEIKIERNQSTNLDTTEANATLNFKLPFEIQYRDVQAGYTAVSGDVQQKEIILTFDDGPHPTLTKKVSDILIKVGAKAHFFQLGKHVQLYPAVTQMIAKNGHSIGNHSWDHPQFSKISFNDQIKQIAQTNKIIINTIGWVDPFFRYPYGATTPEVNQALKTYGIANFLWSVDSNDWKKINSDGSLRTNEQVINDTISQLDQRGRGMVLFHDVHIRTIELLPTFLAKLHKKGYKIVLLQPSDMNSKTNPRLP